MPKYLMGLLLTTALFCPPTATAAPQRFDPDKECSGKDRGAYPWDYRAIVHRQIRKSFYDPRSVVKLQIYKPTPGWFSTIKGKRTRNNTKCYWYIPFQLDSRNPDNRYTGVSDYGLLVKEGRVVHAAERDGISRGVRLDGNRAYSEELAILSPTEQQWVFAQNRRFQEQTTQEVLWIPTYFEELKELEERAKRGVVNKMELTVERTILESYRGTPMASSDCLIGRDLEGELSGPRKIHSPQPSLTSEARLARVQGVVIMRGIVDCRGFLVDLQVVQGLPHGVSETVVETLLQWRFEPATIDGVPVSVEYNTSLNFRSR